jgi:hypothetical protein
MFCVKITIYAAKKVPTEEKTDFINESCGPLVQNSPERCIDDAIRKGNYTLAGSKTFLEIMLIIR